MIGYSYIRRRPASKVRWAIYRDGKLVNGRENLSLREAKSVASRLALELPASKWEVGSYWEDRTYAPLRVGDCRQTRNRNDL